MARIKTLHAVTSSSPFQATIGRLLELNPSKVVVAADPVIAAMGGSAPVVEVGDPHNLTGRQTFGLGRSTKLSPGIRPGEQVLVLSHREGSHLVANGVEPASELSSGAGSVSSLQETPASTKARSVPATSPTGTTPVILDSSVSTTANTVSIKSSWGLPAVYWSASARLHLPFGCTAELELEMILGLSVQLDAPFQISDYGDSLEAVSLDTPYAHGHWGPVGFSANDTDPTLLVNAGASVGLGGMVICGPISYPFPGAGIGWAFQNETNQHLPLAGEPALKVPSTSCPVVGVLKFFSFSACLNMAFEGAPLTANLGGTGLTPSRISLGSSSETPLPSDSSGTAQLSDFGYDPLLVSGLTVGFDQFYDGTSELLKLSGEATTSAHPLPGDAHPAEQRHEDQIGPTLQNGSWMNSDHTWMSADGTPLPPGSIPTGEQIQWGYAHWVHPNQEGPTLPEGQWYDKVAHRWRGPQDPTTIGGSSGNSGTFVKTPGAEEISATASSSYDGGDTNGSDDPNPEKESARASLLLSLPIHWTIADKPAPTPAVASDFTPGSITVPLPRPVPPSPRPTTTGPPPRPASAAPGYATPQQPVAGLLDGLLQGNYYNACSYVLPAQVALCNAGGAFVGSSLLSAGTSWSFGSTVVDGNEAIVVLVGQLCGLVNGSANQCLTNSDPTFGLPANGESFATAYSTALNSNNDNWDVPVEEVNGSWYVNAPA